MVETIAGRTSEVGRIDYVLGRDVTSTIDILLQQDITNMFRYAKIQTPPAVQGDPPTVEVIAMHGAAVVIDLPTAEVRALVSYPTYDLNEFDNNYSKLAGDTLNKPMLNRATKEAHVPGSTVKPIVGLAAITDGLIGANQGIECTGYLVINGNPIRKGFRCWVGGIEICQPAA
jgi:penicillin-binding protein 2